VFIESLNAAIYAIFRQLTPYFQGSHAESRASEPEFVLLAAAVRIISQDLKLVCLPSKLARNNVFLILKSPSPLTAVGFFADLTQSYQVQPCAHPEKRCTDNCLLPLVELPCGNAWGRAQI
jgi:hypothetical protein